ncbi:hypothetical protein RHSIM_RhsimUnG0181800 [Rhododendron simsii]|uniref:Dirigent protein n=1 Tax=Rhododendron simsii TaxID=118357 RepID=A0A834L491_RHOSS|nr:hypothetical protein RHSIM_RhsimUnG0181800 [Rhododendron simsii]
MLKQPTPSVFIAMLVASLLHMVAAVDPATTVGGGEPVLDLYMHDILGGSNPTARPVTGLLGNIYSGQVPFARPSLGKAQGIYVASSADGSTQMMAFTVMMEGGEYGDSLNFFGVYKIRSVMSKLSLTGGTSKYKNACGFAEVRSLIPAGQHVTDGVETLLRITVHLKY